MRIHFHHSFDYTVYSCSLYKCISNIEVFEWTMCHAKDFCIRTIKIRRIKIIHYIYNYKSILYRIIPEPLNSRVSNYFRICCFWWWSKPTQILDSNSPQTHAQQIPTLQTPASTNKFNEEVLKTLRVPELKQLLRDKGKKFSGNKAELIDRLLSR